MVTVITMVEALGVSVLVSAAEGVLIMRVSYMNRMLGAVLDHVAACDRHQRQAAHQNKTST
jgi:hypothetical protein